jgi:hypothetical protein
VKQLHIVPIGDTRKHILTTDCWCQPKVEHESLIPFVTHNAADMRELDTSEHETDDSWKMKVIQN